nr:7-carboxy-7-deazaguanine synthase QueE [Candidatus Sigynarchaeota archaeon]
MLCEIFRSIQGEVQGLGRQALFIRTAGCNLAKNCPVDCDTRYSWEENKKLPFFERSIDALSKEIDAASVDVVVITGGEPLLQQAEIARLIAGQEAKKDANMDWYIETNGTITPISQLINDARIYFNVSPKLASFTYTGFPLSRTIFKHVITPAEFTAWENKMSQLPIEIHRKIYFMPMSRNREQYLQSAPAVANWCNDHGFNFGAREHLVLWDGKRGF